MSSTNRYSEYSMPAVKLLLFVLTLMGLNLSMEYSYLLFHVLIELFSIIVAFSLSVITWNSRQYIKKSVLYDYRDCLPLYRIYRSYAYLELCGDESFSGRVFFCEPAVDRGGDTLKA